LQFLLQWTSAILWPLAMAVSLPPLAYSGTELGRIRTSGQSPAIAPDLQKIEDWQSTHNRKPNQIDLSLTASTCTFKAHLCRIT